MNADIRFRNPLLKVRDDLFERVARILGEAAILSNRTLIREAKEAGKPIPPLYKSGVVYQNEAPGRPDQLVDIPVIMARGWGDCWMLSAWRVAELREQGERARLKVKRKRLRNGKRVFHVLVRRGSGKPEDPSKILGMGKEY